MFQYPSRQGHFLRGSVNGLFTFLTPLPALADQATFSAAILPRIRYTPVRGPL